MEKKIETTIGFRVIRFPSKEWYVSSRTLLVPLLGDIWSLIVGT